MPATVRIAYLDGPRLRRSLIAACDHAQGVRAELNRINVFPVPDGDTGTNLALTLRSIADRLRTNTDRSVGFVAGEAAEAAVLGARGNCGMMLSHFLLGFAQALEGRPRISPSEFADALENGVRSLYEAIDRPVEGTILTVMRETAEAAAEIREAPDFAGVVEQLTVRARESLERTPTLLPALREAGVVDAGAKGFVALLEGVLGYLTGGSLPVPEESSPRSGDEAGMAVAQVEYPSDTEQFRFCTEALVEGDGLPEAAVLRSELAEWGDSVVVIRTGRILKLHVHTDEPEGVFTWLRTLGTLVTHKAEDMRAQHAAVERAAASHLTLARRPVVVVTDSAADLPETLVRAHGIHVVPQALIDGERVLRDGVDIRAEEFHARLAVRDGGPLPTTSQPTPQAFRDAYSRALEEGEEVVAVLLSSGLSGTFASAASAAAAMPDARIHAVDSLGASLLTGLLAVRAAELGEAGIAPARIAERLRTLRKTSGIFLTVDQFDRLLASGRVGKGKAWLGGLLRLKPILGLDGEGKVIPLGKARGGERLIPEVMRLLEERVPAGARVRFGIAHVAIPEVVERVSAALRARHGADVEILSAAVTPVIATHTGVGAWALAWTAEVEPLEEGPA